MPRILSTGGIWIWLNAAWLIVGLFFLQWRPETVVLVYIFETTIIGIICVLKMAALCLWSTENKSDIKQSISKNFSEKELSTLSKIGMDKIAYLLYNIFVIAMFAVVFLGFVWGQSIFTFLMASHSNPGLFAGPDKVLQNLRFLLSQPDMLAAIAGIAVTHIAFLFQQFIIPGEYRRSTLQQLFVQPWVRILTQQLVVIAGGFIFFKTGNNFVAVAVVLIVAKSVIDMTVVQNMERKAIQEVSNTQESMAV